MDSDLNGDAVMNDNDLQNANMMDQMEDLFGESADGLGVQVHLPPSGPPPPPALVQRIAELQTSGACTELAWSNTGSIARISPDGRKIAFSVFVQDPKTGAWAPGKESSFPIISPDAVRFVHLRFSGMGSELAVADDLGLVHVYAGQTGLGRMTAFPTEISYDRAGRSELDAVVGLHWLPLFPTEFKIPYCSPSSKVNGAWMSQVKFRDNSVPRVHHPVDGRNALLSVTRRGTLMLMYQQEGGRWYGITHEMDHIESTDELISHASFCEQDDKVILVTHDAGRRFRVFTIAIAWNPSQYSRPNGQPAIRVAPTLEVGHAASLEHVTPQHSDDRLTLLTVVPSISDYAEPGFPSALTVVAAFSHVPLPADPSQQQQDAFTTISRWHVESVSPSLHDSFGKLKGNSTSSITPKSTRALRRQPDIVTTKLILSVHSLAHGTLLAFVASDGTIEYRERSAFNVIEPFGDTTFVSSLPQAGFEHLSGEHSSHVTMSADGAALAYVRPDGKLDGKTMVFRYGWQPVEDGISDIKGLVDAGIQCIARQHTILTYNGSGTAEVLTLLPHDLSPEMHEQVLRELIRPLTRAYDLSSLDEQKKQQFILRDPNLPRALSAQLSLGLRSSTGEPTMSAQLAWASLNIKHACVSIITIAARQEVPGPDVIHSLRGLARWSVDVFISILHALLAASRRVANDASAAEAVSKYIEDTGNVAINLLLCSYPRSTLRLLASFVPRYFKIVGAVQQRSRSLLEKQQLMETAKLGEASNLPFKFDAIHGFLGEVDKAIQEAYTQAGVQDRARQETELSMLTTCSIPASLHSALTSIISSSLPKLIPDLDMGKIYFWDTTWLRLSPKATQTSSLNNDQDSEPRYDALRKIPIPQGANLRLCRRCGSAMEDIAREPEKVRELPPWLQTAQRSCVCTCSWYLP